MSIFGAIGGLLGGLLSNSAANKRQQEMLAWQERMDNTKIQRLQADAKTAGVHPLAAMGASLTSPSPVTVGGHPDFSDMGQNVGRAVDATMSSGQKDSEYVKKAQLLDLENKQLNNDVIRVQLANSAAATVNQAGNPPTFSSEDLAAEYNKQALRAEAKTQLRENNPLPMGVLGEIKQSRRWAPAQEVEDEYSDIISNIYGVGKWIRDYNRHSKPDGTHPATMRYWRKRYNDWKSRPAPRHSSGW